MMLNNAEQKMNKIEKVVNKKKPTMLIGDIMNVIYDLSCSQGFYGRLYNYLCELQEKDAEQFEEVTRTLKMKSL